MWRLSAGVFVGICAIAVSNAAFLLFAPLGGFPLQSVYGFWNRLLVGLGLLLWAAAIFGASVLACRVAGRLEGMVSILAVLLGTAFLVGVLPEKAGSNAVSYVQLGSAVLSLPLLFVFYVGCIVAYFTRRPDMV